jgi:hypothetical protein
MKSSRQGLMIAAGGPDRGGAWIGGRKRDEYVAGIVAGNAAIAAQSQGDPVRDSFELMRQ